MSRVYFTGIRSPDNGGHYAYLNGLRWTQGDDRTPWGATYGPLRELSDIVSEPHARRDEPEGVLLIEQTAQWTLLGCWDRSADRRGGCCAVWAVDTPNMDDALAAIMNYYGTTVTRIEQHCGAPMGSWPRRTIKEAFPKAPHSVATQTMRTCPTCRGVGEVQK